MRASFFFFLGGGGSTLECSHVQILANGLFLLARWMRVTSEECVERLELVTCHAVARTGQLSRRRHGTTRSVGMGRHEPLVLINERSWWPRVGGKAASDRRRHRRTNVDIGVGDALNRLGIDF